MKNIITIIGGSCCIALALANTQPPVQPIQAQSANPVAVQPDTTGEQIHRLELEVAHLTRRVELLEQEKAAKAVEKPKAASVQRSAAVCAICGPAKANVTYQRRAILLWRR